jgi:glycerophosphoryl diester phosphodiesterase
LKHKPGHETLIIAHRGASAHAPENTKAAFELAIAQGVDGLELDVQLSADGKLVVIHDTHVNRTTNAAGPVSSLTLDELRSLDAGAWFDRRLAMRPRTRLRAAKVTTAAGRKWNGFKGESLPVLEDVLKLASQSRLKRVYVELKGASRNREGLVDAVLEAIDRSAAKDIVTLLSFDHPSISLARARLRNVRTAATFPVGKSLVTARSIALAADKAQANEVALHYGLVTRRAVEFFHTSGLQVSVWTANSTLMLRRLLACGVDAIMTNYPERLLRLVNSEVRAS